MSPKAREAKKRISRNKGQCENAGAGLSFTFGSDNRHDASADGALSAAALQWMTRTHDSFIRLAAAVNLGGQ
jgi:hypothetical protein